MRKYREDGTDYDVAMYAKDSITGSSCLVSTDGYDVRRPTDEEIEYAQDELGATSDITFYEEEV
jgi:hypothetical protein